MEKKDGCILMSENVLRIMDSALEKNEEDKKRIVSGFNSNFFMNIERLIEKQGYDQVTSRIFPGTLSDGEVFDSLQLIRNKIERRGYKTFLECNFTDYPQNTTCFDKREIVYELKIRKKKPSILRKILYG